MAVHFSNTTTAKLEAFARARGVTVGIAKTPSNASGLWHVVAQDKKPLARWVSLGWTVADAKESLEQWSNS